MYSTSLGTRRSAYYVKLMHAIIIFDFSLETMQAMFDFSLDTKLRGKGDIYNYVCTSVHIQDTA